MHPIILKVRTGSHCHGTALPTSDEDIRGVCIPDEHYFLGIKTFEQYENKETDTVIYGWQKFLHLAIKGNMSIMNIMFVHKKDILFKDEFGDRLLAFRENFLTGKIINAAYGFCKSQIHKMARSHGDCGNRKELVDKYGYDTKFAYHAVMITNMSIDLLKSGVYQPLRSPSEQKLLLSIRKGEIPHEKVMEILQQNLLTIKTLEIITDLPKEPDGEKISEFSVNFLKDYFKYAKRDNPNPVG